MSKDLRCPQVAHSALPSGGSQSSGHIRYKPKTAAIPLHKRADKARRYSALPWMVLTDTSLEHVDMLVYACLSANAFKGDTTRSAGRWISESVYVSQRTVSRSLKRLIKRGHVEIVVSARGNQAPIYRLTSPVFGKRQKIILEAGGKPNLTTRADIETLRERVRLRQSK